mmetsp:Transcript_20802/g.47221  ORF Transcript_20802/g.47221 Transcript_20802/m.47221 type:complete len:91 (-) Transcript_20802:416-688(-)
MFFQACRPFFPNVPFRNYFILGLYSPVHFCSFPPPCWAALCCAEGRANLVIATNNNETVIVELKRSEGPKAVEAIMQQVEENQIIVREST